MQPAEVVAQLLKHTPPSELSNGLNLTVVQLLRTQVDQLKIKDAAAALEVAKIANAVAETLADDRAKALAALAKGASLAHLIRAKESLSEYEAAAALYERLNDFEKLTQVRVLMVWSLFATGQRDAALVMAQQARAGCVVLGKPVERDLARLEMTSGIIHKQMGDFEAALVAYERSYQLLLHLGEQIEAARVNINRANVLQEMDRYQQAETLYEQARQTLADSAEYKELVAHIDSNLGLLAFRRGQYQESLSHFEAAFTGFAGNPNFAARVNFRRALVYEKLNLLPELIQMAQSAIAIFVEKGMAREAGLANHALAMGYEKSGYHALALAHYQAAIEAFTAQKADLRRLKTEISLAQLHYKNGDYSSAQRVINQLLENQALDTWPQLNAQAHLLLAKVAFRNQQIPNQNNQVVELAQRAQTLAQQFKLTRIDSEVALLFAEHSQAKGNKAETLQMYKRAMAMIQDQRDLLLHDEFQLGFMDDKLQQFSGLLRLLTEETAWLDELVDFLNWQQTAPLVKLGGDGAAVSAEIEQLRQDWHWQQTKLDGLTAPLEIEAARQALQLLEDQIAEATRRHAIRHSRQVQVDGALPTPTPAANNLRSAIQAKLTMDQALVQFFVSNEHFHAVVITADAATSLCCGQVKRVDRALRAWQNHIRDTQLLLESAELSRQLANRFLLVLFNELMLPLADHLREKTAFYIVLPPEWHALPVAAFYDGETYLIEKSALTFITSPDIVLEQPNEMKANQKEVLVIGHSDGGLLPNSLVEAEKISAALAADNHTTLLLEQHATIQQFRRLAPAAHIIHLSTHAVFRPDNPLFSWLRLDNQRLTMSEIYNMSLAARPLVVLSACETGRGQARGGGLSGLARALLSAGAAHILVTQWRVEEATTSFIMQSFYERVTDSAEPRVVSQALQQAQRALAQTHHPFFWAGFVFIQG